MSTPLESRPPKAGNQATAGRLVLIVEDERSIAQVVAEVVADANYLPYVARHGLDALELARERWPALVITDLMLPRLDGEGLIAALRAEARDDTERPMPPVILMTAAGMKIAQAAGADAILHKPFDLAELEALLLHYLAE
jgi:two-component system, chemotaxis family, chemotaxis protein CheY